MECPSCGAEVTEILARHEYTISYSEEQGKWVKDVGEAGYSCGNCLGNLEPRDIEDILRQVDEL